MKIDMISGFIEAAGIMPEKSPFLRPLFLPSGGPPSRLNNPFVSFALSTRRTLS
jgi:hypothetical protein